MKRTLKRGLKDLKSLSRKRLEGSHLRGDVGARRPASAGSADRQDRARTLGNGLLRLFRSAKGRLDCARGNKRGGATRPSRSLPAKPRARPRELYTREPVRDVSNWPVLKHGPRSVPIVRVIGRRNPIAQRNRVQAASLARDAAAAYPDSPRKG